MLYVFHVDRGTLVTFDMQLSLAFVQDLKVEIERAFNIPCDKQVLMVSGGQCLENTARVCNFGTGTDTNPVYLFSRELAEYFDPPMPLPDVTPDIDLTDQTDTAKSLPKIYNTIVVRTKLAQKFYELSREQSFMCDRLVLDQHRQQQGWAAVAAHLEDTVNEFKKKADAFLRSYQCQQEINEKYKMHLQNFPKNLEVLSKIPVIPALLNKLRDHSDEAKLTELGFGEEQAEVESTSVPSSPLSDEDTGELSGEISLLQWVAMKDNVYTLENVAYICNILMNELDQNNIELWKREKDEVIEYIYSMPLKEISGLGDRLFGLDQLMGDVKGLVNSQGEIAQSFAQNQSRASDLRDTSVIPDLCKSHSQQLGVMLENYNKIRDIKRRCRCAKEELCVNLHKRLKWVVQSEKQLTQIDCKLTMFIGKQNRLQHILRVLDQINQAPEMYLNAVTEVVRRRHFSQAFLSWASDLACHLTTIHNEEVMRRQEFHSEFERSFLVSLFAGLNDMPPPYATEPPQMFDIGLPLLTLEDVEHIKEILPNLAEKIKMPDFSALTHFFQSKNLSGVKFEERGVGDDRCIEDRLVEVVTEAGLGSALDRGLLRPSDSQISATSSHLTHPHLKDFDRGFESETDTEEFEKVGQSPVEMQVETKQLEVVSSRSTATLDASTLTEVGDHGNLPRSPIPPKKPPRAFGRSSFTTSYYKPNIRIHPEECRFIYSLKLDASDSDTNFEPKLEFEAIMSNPFPIKTLVQESQSPSSTCNHDSSVTESTCELGAELNARTSPISDPGVSPTSPCVLSQGHQGPSEFVTTEYYIDESMPSSLSTDGGGPLLLSSAELLRQLDDSNTVVALLQDNLATVKNEVGQVKSLLRKSVNFSETLIAMLRTELLSIKSTVSTEQDQFKDNLALMMTAWDTFRADTKQFEREKIQRLTVDHELEMIDIKNLAITKDDEIRSLKLEKIEMECRYNKRVEEGLNKLVEVENHLQETRQKCENYEKELENLKQEYEQNIMQLREQMNREHQNEIESLRSRFRLQFAVANMERSPSDTSLERIERNDVIELVNHESIVAQLKENCSVELETAVKNAVEIERQRWEAVVESEMERKCRESDAMNIRCISPVMSDACNEKDKKIDDLLLAQSLLQKERCKSKETITFLDKIEQLEQDNCRLEAELSMERSKRLHNMTPQMHCSIASSSGLNRDCFRMPLMSDASTNTENRTLRTLSRSQLKMIQNYNVNINSCAVGSRVLVIWNRHLENYIIVMDSSSICFLTPDSIPVLGLTTLRDASRKDHAVGEVTEKEFCYVKKAENRYHLPKGTRFHRVRVKPLPKDVELAVRESFDTSSTSSKDTSTSSLASELTLQERFSCKPSTSQHLGAIPRSTNPSIPSKSKIVDSTSSENEMQTPRPMVGAAVSPFVTRSLFGGSPTLSGSFSIYHSLSQPSSLVSCSESEPATPNKLDDEVDNSAPYVQDEKDR